LSSSGISTGGVTRQAATMSHPKLSDKMKRLWANPETRAKMLAGAKKGSEVKRSQRTEAEKEVRRLRSRRKAS
jgi:hypothetical protein